MKFKRVFAFIFIFVFVLGASFSFATANPNVSVVNPAEGSTVYSDSLLVSVKVSQPATMAVNVYQVLQTGEDGKTLEAVSIEDYKANLELDAASRQTWKYSKIMDEETVTYTANLSFYTKKIEDVKPGTYYIKCTTVDENGIVLYTNATYVGIKDKSEDPAQQAQQTQSTGRFSVLVNLLKTLFGN